MFSPRIKLLSRNNLRYWTGLVHVIYIVPMSNVQEQEKWHPWKIGDRLKTAREEAGFDQREFSALTGISRGTIVNYETGKTEPRDPALLSWAHHTKHSLTWIKTGNPPTSDDGGPGNVIPIGRKTDPTLETHKLLCTCASCQPLPKAA